MAGKPRTLRKLGAVTLIGVSACSLLAPDDDEFLGHPPSTPELPVGAGGTGSADDAGQGGRARGGSEGATAGAAGEEASSAGGSVNGDSGGAGETSGGQAAHDGGGDGGGAPSGGTSAGGMGVGGGSSGGGGRGGAGTGGLGGNGAGGTSLGGGGVGGSPNPCGTVTPVCTPGQRATQQRACTDCTGVMQSRTRTCSASCSWGAWGSWSACGVCSRDEFQCCGNRGWQFCNPATCQWNPCRDNCAADSTCDC